MNYKKFIKKLSYLFLSFALTTSFTSCEAEDSVPADSDIVLQDLVATWVVNIDEDGIPQAEGTTISTYNTSANSTDAFWVDDQQHGWGLKAQVSYDSGAMTFSGTDLNELYYGVTVTISEGVIIENGGTTPDGEVVDSIYFKAQFSDQSGEVWEYYGFKSTSRIGN